MICPNCRQAVEERHNLKPEGRPEPKHNAWYVCRECGSISRFVEIASPLREHDQGRPGSHLMLRSASIDEFADSITDHVLLIGTRRKILAKAAAKAAKKVTAK